jgi:hypothetical protein
MDPDDAETYQIVPTAAGLNITIHLDMVNWGQIQNDGEQRVDLGGEHGISEIILKR